MINTGNERQICFSRPRRLTNVSSWHIHIPFAFYLVQQLKPRTLVELGVHKGDSYCTWCQAVDELDLTTLCYGVDTWIGDKHAGLYSEDVFNEFRQYHEEHYGSFSKLVRSTFDEALGNFSDGSIDLLHIDGSHGYTDVRNDFSRWLPKMSNRGIILLHDIFVKESDFGVWRFWEESKNVYPNFELPHQYGLGIISVNKQVPEELDHIFNARGIERGNFSRLFYLLGLSVRTRRADETKIPASKSSRGGIRAFWRGIMS